MIFPTDKKIIFCVALAAFTFQFEAFSISVALPNMANEMKASTTTVSFVVLTYLLGASIAFLPSGHLANRFGLRSVFLLGCLFAAIASLVCGMSQSLHVLYVGRFILGLGAGAMVATGYAMIPVWVSQRRIGWGYSMLSLGAGLGMLIGVPIGGAIAYLLSWNWIFISATPLFGVLLYMGFVSLPTTKYNHQTTGADHPIDWLGLFLGSALIGLTVLVFSLGAELGWASLSIFLLIALVLLIASITVRRACRGKSLISLHLLHSRMFICPLAILFVFNFASSGIRFLIPFYLEYGNGLSVLMSSVVMVAYPLGFSLMSTWSGRVTDRVGAYLVVKGALFLTAITCSLYVLLIPSNMIFICAGFMVLLGIEAALFSPANNRLITSNVSSQDRVEASALLPIALNTGSLLGVSVFETVFSFDFPKVGTQTLGHSPASAIAAQGLQLGLVYSIGLAALMLWVALLSMGRLMGETTE